MDLSTTDRNAHVHPAFRDALKWISQPQVPHVIVRDVSGCGLDGETVSRCSCGWKGRPVSQASDFQSTELANQENAHRFSCASVDQLRREGKL